MNQVFFIKDIEYMIDRWKSFVIVSSGNSFKTDESTWITIDMDDTLSSKIFTI